MINIIHYAVILTYVHLPTHAYIPTYTTRMYICMYEPTYASLRLKQLLRQIVAKSRGLQAEMVTTVASSQTDFAVVQKSSEDVLLRHGRLQQLSGERDIYELISRGYSTKIPLIGDSTSACDGVLLQHPVLKVAISSGKHRLQHLVRKKQLVASDIQAGEASLNSCPHDSFQKNFCCGRNPTHMVSVKARKWSVQRQQTIWP